VDVTFGDRDTMLQISSSMASGLEADFGY
jgi:hypothetical protein